MPGVPTPQVPSDKYLVTECQTSDGYIFVELKGNKFLTIVGAMSSSLIDVPFYDGGNYRDIVDSSFLGRAPVSIIEQTGFTDNIPLNGDLLATPGNIGVPDQIATMMEEDDNFSHTEPHPELHARALMQWWDEFSGNGNELARAWLDRIEGTSSRVPQSNGSVPPVFTP